MQVGFVEQRLEMTVGDWTAHNVCTRASSVVQAAATALSWQLRNLPPPQMQEMLGSHSLGHQHGSVAIEHRSLAA